MSVVDRDDKINQISRGFKLDLALWMREWQDLIAKYCENAAERSSLQLNIRIQHMWASMAFNLRALAASGIENIAIMTDKQRGLAMAAKNAAESHLQLLLSSMSSTDLGGQGYHRPYISSFRYAMEFVWAKNSFSILIVLRLSLLLGDPPEFLLARLAEAKDFLDELARIGMSANASYFKIVAQTVRRCEKAIQTCLQPDANGGLSDQDEDFSTFVPEEFVFEWDFPGLHLCYVPMDWQELFVDFGAAG